MAKSIRPLDMKLQGAEEFVWVGRPELDREYCRADRILLPVSLLLVALCTLFAVMMVFFSVKTGFSTKYIPGLLMLLLAGGFSCYSYFFRFSAKRRMKSRLTYGVTNRHRALIYDAAADRVYELSAQQTCGAYVAEEDAHGVGTIYFEKKTSGRFFDNTGLDFMGSGKAARSALLDVAGCRRIVKYLNGK